MQFAISDDDVANHKIAKEGDKEDDRVGGNGEQIFDVVLLLESFTVQTAEILYGHHFAVTKVGRSP